MLVSFQKFIQKCVHEKKFHNRIAEEKAPCLFALLQKKLVDWSKKAFAQIKKENSKNCHDLKYGERLAISREFKDYGDFPIIEELLLNSGDLWQFPVDNKIRLVGIFKENYFKSKDEANDDLLYALFFDFEHIRYPSDKEEDKIEKRDLFCIMKGKKDCKQKNKQN